eukprot:7307803-Alexandrium_andersonii.AAC.1
MSASLVGSEMCIRDSVSGDNAGEVEGLPPRGCWRLSAPGGLDVAGAWGCLLYTSDAADDM